MGLLFQVFAENGFLFLYFLHADEILLLLLEEILELLLEFKELLFELLDLCFFGFH